MWSNNNTPIGGENLSQFIKVNSSIMTERTGSQISLSFFNLAKVDTFQFSSLETATTTVLLKEQYPNKVFFYC